MRRCAYKMSDVLIVHNEAGRDILIRQFNQPPEKIEIIPHGPMNIGNRLGSPPPASGELRLLLFGSIRENKGIRLAIEGVKKVNASGQLRAKLTIAGQAENSTDGSYWQTCLDSIALSPEMFDVMYRYIDENRGAGSGRTPPCRDPPLYGLRLGEWCGGACVDARAPAYRDTSRRLG